jgi:hypothetical protein
MTPRKDVQAVWQILLDVLGSGKGRPKLPDGWRLRLQQDLEETLLDSSRVHDRVRQLRQSGPASRADERLPEAELERALYHGLAALPDDDLAALALSPVALVVLHERILHEFPDPWLGLLREQGRRLMQRSGRRRPDFRSLVSSATQSANGSWQFELATADCHWSAPAPAEPTGRVEVQRQPAGRLRLSLSGFLRPAPGCTLYVRWLDGDDNLRGEATTTDPGAIELASSDGHGPRAGDRLLIRRRQAGAELLCRVEL